MTTSPAATILFVDDEQNLLDALSRQLRKSYSFTTSLGPEDALKRIETGESFAVVVSDHNMPKMTGVDFLSRVAECQPAAIRMLLTGNADLQIALEAVNRGHIFRLLVKPCAQDELRSALDAALEQFRLHAAERDLLEQTLGGCVQLVVEIVSHMCPDAFGRAARLKGYVRDVANRIKLEPVWHLETAAVLSQLGFVALPPEILQRATRRNQLSPEERRVFDAHPRVARNLLARIPRLEIVAEIIGQLATSDGPQSDSTENPWTAKAAPAAEVLRACIVFDDLISSGSRPEDAARSAAAIPGLTPVVARAISNLRALTNGSVSVIVPVRRLLHGMILDQDLRRPDGQLVIASGHEITPSLLERLRNHVNLGQITGSVRVRMAEPPSSPKSQYDTHSDPIGNGTSSSTRILPAGAASPAKKGLPS